MDAMFERIRRVGIVPVIKITHPDQALPLARALDRGGIPVAEVTFRTEHAAEAIRRIALEMPDMLTGAGTVTRTEQADEALEAGARFVVTPGFNPKVVDHCIQRGIPVVPGAPTTSDIEQALERGSRWSSSPRPWATCPISRRSRRPTPASPSCPQAVPPGNLADYPANPACWPAAALRWTPADWRRAAGGDHAPVPRAVNLALGLKVLRVGIFSGSAGDAAQSAALFSALLGVPAAPTPEGHAVDAHVEILKADGSGEHGCLVLGCSSLDRAMFQLQRRGFAFAGETPETDAAGKRCLRLKGSIAGLSIKLTEI